MGQIGPNVLPTIAHAVGYTFRKVDPIIGELGNPVGIKCYRPYHSVGEDFLPSFLGMVGLPVEIVPEYPSVESIILLTESAAFDEQLILQIQESLLEGKTVVITSGLLKVLEKKGLNDIAEIRYTDNKMLVNEFVVDYRRIPAEKEILIPQIRYLTNDSWEVISAINGPVGYPILLEAGYNEGRLFVLTIPENYTDLYGLPEPVLTRLRVLLGEDQMAQLSGPGNISLFLYDNNSLIVESFRDETVSLKILADVNAISLIDIQTGESVSGTSEPARGGWNFSKIPEKRVFEFTLKPHSFRVFRLIYGNTTR